MDAMKSGKKQPKHGQGDESIASMLMDEADRVNASEAQPDWDRLGLLLEEAKRAGKPDVDAFMARAAKMVPADCPEVLADLRRELEALR